ncbi:MAG: ankyrin repeat domain-containing protein [Actinobacteria bacterium]|nr:ankyrin repeat domain-containing protein [Actinomycetota bacterium]
MAAEPTSPEPSDEAVIALAQRLFDYARAGDTATLERYLDAGAPVDLCGSTGDTLLMLAAYHGHGETVRMLIERGADVDAANVKGQVPIAGATFKGYVEVVEILAAAGADPNAGQPTAIETAKMFGRDDLLAILQG